jgi:hypothetical protein
MKKQHKQGLISEEELKRAEQAFAEAESQEQQLALLMEFYAQLGG